MIYDKIFASAYNAYSKHAGEQPHTSAVIYVSACEMLLILLVIHVIKSLCAIDLLNWAPNKYYLLPIVVLIFIANHLYFSSKRSNRILEEFHGMTKIKRRFWGVIALSAFILPLGIIMFSLV